MRLPFGGVGVGVNVPYLWRAIQDNCIAEQIAVTQSIDSSLEFYASLFFIENSCLPGFLTGMPWNAG